MRVTMQEALYGAETAAPLGRVYTSLEEVRRAVGVILDSVWCREAYPRVRAIAVHARDGRTNESVGAWFEDDWTGQVELLKVHWNDRTICHEVAHVLAGSRGSQAHDPEFCRAYLLAYYHTVGPEAWQVLRQSLLDAGCAIDPREDS